MNTLCRFLVVSILMSIAWIGSPVLAQQSQTQTRHDPNTDSAGNPLPGSSIPCAPIAEKRQEFGCYVLARPQLGALPQGSPLSWRLDTFASRPVADAAKGEHSTVVEVFDRIWLFTIAAPAWQPGAGAEHVATVGPLPLGNSASQRHQRDRYADGRVRVWSCAVIYR